MKTEKVQKLKHGLYKIYWKKKEGGGSSLAAVGSMTDGSRWFACTNWSSEFEGNIISRNWKRVRKVSLVKMNMKPPF